MKLLPVGDDVVDVPHHDRLLVGGEPEAGDCVRIEWVSKPLGDLIEHCLLTVQELRVTPCVAEKRQ